MFTVIALPSFLAGQGLGLALGFLAGVFTPGVLRKLRALVKNEEVKFVGGIGAAEAKAKADITAVAKKL